MRVWRVLVRGGAHRCVCGVVEDVVVRSAVVTSKSLGRDGGGGIEGGRPWDDDLEVGNER